LNKKMFVEHNKKKLLILRREKILCVTIEEN